MWRSTNVFTRHRDDSRISEGKLTKPRQLDIHVLMNAIDRHDSEWLTAQSDEVRSEFIPLVAMRWASGLSGPEAPFTCWLLNQRVNRRLFDLDTDLSYRLLAACGLHRQLRHSWLAAANQTSGNAAYRLLAEYHPAASDDELRILLSLYSREEFAEFVNDCGLTKNEAKTYLTAYDKAI